jgi:nicotinamidase-related amidase
MDGNNTGVNDDVDNGNVDNDDTVINDDTTNVNDNNDNTVIDDTTNVNTTLNVLVVVDVQDCFMSNILSNYNFLNFGIGQEVDKKLELSAVMVKKIAELSDKNQIVVFTRDMHPQNHISFEGDEGRPLDPPHGYWPHHCRTGKSCGDRENFNTLYDTENNEREPKGSIKLSEIMKTNYASIKRNIDELKFGTQGYDSTSSNDITIKGNQLSYFFYFTKLANIVKKFNDETNKNIISIMDNVETNAEPSAEQINLKVEGISDTYQFRNTKFYSLFKGERCNYESYSAFNYHLNYNMSNYKKEPNQDEINTEKSEMIKDDETAKKIAQWKNVQELIKIVGPDNKKYTTGLFEFIIQEVTKNPDIKTINFNICGLVGDVCVMHSAIQGSLLWEKTYKSMLPNVTCNFNIELAATAFLGPGGFKPTQPGYYKNISDKNAALEEYKKFYKSETEGYVDNVDDAKYSFVLDGVDASTIASLPPPPPTEPTTLLPPTPPERELSGGRKRTRRNRKFSMHKKHKQNCNCKFCLYGGGKRKSMKKRRQTKKRRQRK